MGATEEAAMGGVDDGGGKADERRARLAAALRANLRRRKAQARARREDGKASEGDASGQPDADAAPPRRP
jgi:hypothetical protein